MTVLNFFMCFAFLASYVRGSLDCVDKNVKIDAMFVVDNTFSMGPYLEAVSAALPKLEDEMKDFSDDSRFGYVTFNDKDLSCINELKNYCARLENGLTRDVDTIRAKLSNTSSDFGGGMPEEDVMGGMLIAALHKNAGWREDSQDTVIQRVAVIITDAVYRIPDGTIPICSRRLTSWRENTGTADYNCHTDDFPTIAQVSRAFEKVNIYPVFIVATKDKTLDEINRLEIAYQNFIELRGKGYYTTLGTTDSNELRQRISVGFEKAVCGSSTTSTTLPPTFSTLPSNKPTVPTNKPTEPSNKPTKPSNKPTLPSNKPTEPTNKPTKPSNKPTKPSNKPTKPSNKPTEPSNKPTKPSNKPTKPSNKPTEPTNKPTKPSNNPTEPTNKPTKPSNKPTEPSNKPTKPSNKPTVPTNKPTEPSNKPTEPSNKPTEPSDKPTEPSNKPTVPCNKPTIPKLTTTKGTTSTTPTASKVTTSFTGHTIFSTGHFLTTTTSQDNPVVGSIMPIALAAGSTGIIFGAVGAIAYVMRANNNVEALDGDWEDHAGQEETDREQVVAIKEDGFTA